MSAETVGPLGTGNAKTIVRVLLASLVALMGLGSIAFPELLWGVSHFRFLTNPLLPIVVALLFVVLLFEPKNSVALLASPKMSSRWAFGIFAAVFAVLFWVFRTKTVFMGDADYLLGHLAHGGSMPSDVLDFEIHQQFFKAFLAPNQKEPILTYNIMSSFAGLLFLGGAALFAKRIAETSFDRVFAFLFVVFSGFMVIFFGYVESYAFLYVSTIFYLATSADALIRGKKLYLPLLFFALSFSFHQTAILLGPSLAYLFWARHRNDEKWLKALGIYSAFLAGVLLLILGYLMASGFSFKEYREMLAVRSTEEGGLILPLFGTKSILAPSHLIDFGNYLLLVAPVASVLLPFVLADKRVYRDKVAVFFLVAGAFSFLFFFVMDPKIEMHRDWDLFTAPSIPLTLLAGYSFVKWQYLAHARVLKVVLLLVAALHMTGWASINGSGLGSARRFEMLVERKNRNPRPLLVGHNYQQLANFYRENGNPDKARGLLRSSAEYSKNPRFCSQVAAMYAQRGQLDSAAHFFEIAVETKPTFVQGWLNLAVIAFRSSQHDKVIAYGTQVLRYAPRNDFALGLMGKSYIGERQFDKAAEVLDRAVKIRPNDAEKHYDLSIALFHSGNPSAAAAHLDHARRLGYKRIDPSFAARLQGKSP